MLIAGKDIEGVGLGHGTVRLPGPNRRGLRGDRACRPGRRGDAHRYGASYTRPGIESYAEQVVARALRGLTTRRPLVATKGGHWHRAGSFPAWT
jgi:hypothetical protein